MSVKANSDNLFLQISASANYTDPATSVTFTEADPTSIKPATPIMASGNASITKWQTATSNNPANATSGATQTDIEDDNLGSHVYSKVLHFKLVSHSTASATNLVIKDVSMTGGTENNELNKSLRVAVAGSDGVQVWTNTTGTWAKDAEKSDTAILDSVTDTDATATLYIWFEGTDETCITNNAGTLDTLNFTVTFSVTQG